MSSPPAPIDICRPSVACCPPLSDEELAPVPLDTTQDFVATLLQKVTDAFSEDDEYSPKSQRNILKELNQNISKIPLPSGIPFFQMYMSPNSYLTTDAQNLLQHDDPIRYQDGRWSGTIRIHGNAGALSLMGTSEYPTFMARIISIRLEGTGVDDLHLWVKAAFRNWFYQKAAELFFLGKPNAQSEYDVMPMVRKQKKDPDAGGPSLADQIKNFISKQSETQGAQPSVPAEKPKTVNERMVAALFENVPKSPKSKETPPLKLPDWREVRTDGYVDFNNPVLEDPKLGKISVEHVTNEIHPDPKDGSVEALVIGAARIQYENSGVEALKDSGAVIEGLTIGLGQLVEYDQKEQWINGHGSLGWNRIGIMAPQGIQPTFGCKTEPCEKNVSGFRFEMGRRGIWALFDKRREPLASRKTQGFIDGRYLRVGMTPEGRIALDGSVGVTLKTNQPLHVLSMADVSGAGSFDFNFFSPDILAKKGELGFAFDVEKGEISLYSETPVRDRFAGASLPDRATITGNIILDLDGPDPMTLNLDRTAGHIKIDAKAVAQAVSVMAETTGLPPELLGVQVTLHADGSADLMMKSHAAGLHARVETSYLIHDINSRSETYSVHGHLSADHKRLEVESFDPYQPVFMLGEARRGFFEFNMKPASPLVDPFLEHFEVQSGLLAFRRVVFDLGKKSFFFDADLEVQNQISQGIIARMEAHGWSLEQGAVAVKNWSVGVQAKDLTIGEAPTSQMAFKIPDNPKPVFVDLTLDPDHLQKTTEKPSPPPSPLAALMPLLMAVNGVDFDFRIPEKAGNPLISIFGKLGAGLEIKKDTVWRARVQTAFQDGTTVLKTLSLEPRDAAPIRVKIGSVPILDNNWALKGIDLVPDKDGRHGRMIVHWNSIFTPNVIDLIIPQIKKMMGLTDGELIRLGFELKRNRWTIPTDLKAIEGIAIKIALFAMTGEQAGQNKVGQTAASVFAEAPVLDMGAIAGDGRADIAAGTFLYDTHKADPHMAVSVTVEGQDGDPVALTVRKRSHDPFYYLNPIAVKGAMVLLGHKDQGAPGPLVQMGEPFTAPDNRAFVGLEGFLLEGAALEPFKQIVRAKEISADTILARLGLDPAHPENALGLFVKDVFLKDFAVSRVNMVDSIDPKKRSYPAIVIKAKGAGYKYLLGQGVTRDKTAVLHGQVWKGDPDIEDFQMTIFPHRLEIRYGNDDDRIQSEGLNGSLNINDLKLRIVRGLMTASIDDLSNGAKLAHFGALEIEKGLIHVLGDKIDIIEPPTSKGQKKDPPANRITGVSLRIDKDATTLSAENFDLWFSGVVLNLAVGTVNGLNNVRMNFPINHLFGPLYATPIGEDGIDMNGAMTLDSRGILDLDYNGGVRLSSLKAAVGLKGTVNRFFSKKDNSSGYLFSDLDLSFDDIEVGYDLLHVLSGGIKKPDFTKLEAPSHGSIHIKRGWFKNEPQRKIIHLQGISWNVETHSRSSRLKLYRKGGSGKEIAFTDASLSTSAEIPAEVVLVCENGEWTRTYGKAESVSAKISGAGGTLR